MCLQSKLAVQYAFESVDLSNKDQWYFCCKSSIPCIK